ncbi:penicillin-binding protein activator, partial [Candidatus Woesearchaeota archaeon]|nr:penicillin-binding protein activator [Candidatus Woesearchaeota archaeon]
MKKLLLILTLSILLFGCVSKSSSEEVIKIGAIAPLTGDVANYGEASRNGIQLAVDEINSAGGINGKKIEVLWEDGQCKAQPASTAANKLIDVDKVSVIIGTVCSSETLAIAPIAEENKVVVVSAASSSPDITKSGDYIFRVWPSDTGQADAMAKHIYNTEKLTKVALMYPNSDYNLALASAFKKTFESLGGIIAAKEVYEQEAKDFRTQIAKVKDSNPEAVYIIPYGEGGILTKQLRELGFEGKIFASETYGTQEVLNDAGDSSEGIIYATPKFDDSLSGTADFLKRYKEKFKK